MTISVTLERPIYGVDWVDAEVQRAAGRFLDTLRSTRDRGHAATVTLYHEVCAIEDRLVAADPGADLELGHETVGDFVEDALREAAAVDNPSRLANEVRWRTLDFRHVSLVHAVQCTSSLTGVSAGDCVGAVAEALVAAAVAADSVEWPELGTFAVRTARPRGGRGLPTGKPMQAWLQLRPSDFDDATFGRGEPPGWLVATVARLEPALAGRANEVVTAVVSALARELAIPETVVDWPGVGSLHVIRSAARSIRNPETGSTVELPAARARVFLDSESWAMGEAPPPDAKAG